MSRTKRKPYPKTGKEVGRGECPESFRIKQTRGHVKNSIYDNENQQEVWSQKGKKHLKRLTSKKRRRKERIKIEMSM
ncbi:MAG: hypothetical protein ACFFG0_00480 [Candidatus Thorarchaeota archaeon]